MVVEKDWFEEVRKVRKNCLVGKLVLNKRVNVEVMKNVLSIIWRISSGMVIKEVGERLFVFQFEDNMENERVVMKQPRSFNKSLLVLEKFDEHSKEVKLQCCPF